MSILPQLIFNSIIAGAIYSMVALGFNLIFGTVKFFDLGYGALAVVGGYTVYYLYKLHDFNLYGSVVAGMFVAALIGFLVDRFIYRTLRKRKASNMILLIASLGVFTTIQAIIAIIFTSQFQTLSSNVGSDRVYQIFGAVITEVQLIILISGIVIMAMLSWFLNRTITGKAIKAISDDEEVSKIVGINTNKIIGFVFAIGSAISGLAGIFVGFDTGIQPTMGLALLLKGIIAAIIGGVGNIYGGVLGAFLLGFVENFGIWKISGEWKDAIAFAMLIIFLLFRPQGIMRK